MQTAASSEILSSERTLAEPPTDSNWQLDDEISEFTFWQRGRLNIGIVAMLLLFNAFWNGIVSVFVMALFGLMPLQNNLPDWEWWGLFVFLVPFEAIGLLMFVGLVFAVLEPFRKTVWRFEQARIERQLCWPLYRHARAWEVVNLGRLELRRGASQQRFKVETASTAGETSFSLMFVAVDNVDLCAIGDLTEGEARWLARVVLERRAKWFGQ